MKTFTKILTAAAATALLATGCVNEDPAYKNNEPGTPPDPNAKGYLTLADMSMRVVVDTDTETRPDDTSDETAKPQTRTDEAQPDVDTFIIEIRDATGKLALQETYGDLKVSIGEAGRLELPVGGYTMEVRSEEAATTPAAEWEHPVYFGSQEFVIEKNQTTPINEVVCTLHNITAKLMEMGVTVVEYDDAVRVRCDGPLSKCNVKTMPHPGFPTDMQPQIAALLSIAQGTSILNESVWENRFRYVEELKRMGAQITVEGKSAIIEGVEYLKGAPVRATDLRAGAAMIIAGLAAHGVTKIEDIEHIQRGYEDIVEKFVGLGAWHRDIEDVEKELDEIQALGLHGIKLHSDFQGFAIDDEKMLPVYKACMARDLPILFHMGDARSELSAPKKLANVLEKLPELKCIAAHLGGYQRWDEAKACLKGANVWVDTSSSLFVLNPDEARRSIEHFGIDKVMFGTDFPMWTHEKELERFFALAYGEEENRKMLYDNFEKLFKL